VGDDGAHVKPMGINVLFSPGSASFNNLYLEGYGALFILHVRLPLLPPPAKPAREKEKPAADSTWQEAWQELYGGRPGEKPAMEPAIEYSEEKVTRLKESLVEALKNATNLRDLKPEESVTVCVFGDGGVRFAKTAAFSGTDPAHKGEQNRAESVVRTWAVAGNGTHTGSATMTIRVKKADVDAFAKGKLTLQEFQKKAKIAIYEGGPQKAGSPAAGLVGP